MMIGLPFIPMDQVKAEAARHNCGVMQAHFRIQCREYLKQRKARRQALIASVHREGQVT